jgi:hypothetical protein
MVRRIKAGGLVLCNIIHQDRQLRISKTDQEEKYIRAVILIVEW